MIMYKDDNDKKRKSIIVECECSTHFMQVTKYDIDDCIYITFLEDSFYSMQRTFWETIKSRIKLAWLMLKGKRYRLEEVIINKKDIDKLIKALKEMRDF